ncbi:MAG: four helix bundle protein [Candidatus Cloacimonadota bacterium]|nr:four helix bundle protein [Candidatus Cloacimonadota bacterium]
MSEGFSNLKVYKMSYDMAMEIFNITKSFPKEEIYALTDQIRRSSRSVCSNIAEAYRKRRYPKHFTSKVSDADGEASETMVWVNFAKDCNYINKNIYNNLIKKYKEIGKMLGSMANHPERFIPKE